MLKTVPGFPYYIDVSVSTRTAMNNDGTFRDDVLAEKYNTDFKYGLIVARPTIIDSAVVKHVDKLLRSQSVVIVDEPHMEESTKEAPIAASLGHAIDILVQGMAEAYKNASANYWPGINPPELYYYSHPAASKGFFLDELSKLKTIEELTANGKKPSNEDVMASSLKLRIDALVTGESFIESLAISNLAAVLVSDYDEKTAKIPYPKSNWEKLYVDYTKELVLINRRLSEKQRRDIRQIYKNIKEYRP